jgi:hypothetical protein
VGAADERAGAGEAVAQSLIRGYCACHRNSN